MAKGTCAHIFLFIALLSSTTISYAQLPNSGETIVIADLSYEWLVYDKEEGILFPYMGEQDIHDIYFQIPTDKYAGFHLQIFSNPGDFLYVNGKLCAEISSSGLVISLDSMKAKIKNELLFSIYSYNLEPTKVKTEVVKFDSGLGVSSGRVLVTDARLGIKDHDYLKLAFITVFGLLVIFRTVNVKLFNEYFAVHHAYSLRQRFEIITSQSFLSVYNLSYILLFACLISVSLLGLWQINPQSMMIDLDQYSSRPLTKVILIFIGSIVLIIIKLPLITVFNSLFQLRKVRDLQYAIFIRHSLILSALIFCLSVFNFGWDGEVVESYEGLISGLIFVLLWLQVLVTFLVLNSQLNFHKLHLFAYLCSTEIIPLIVFLKFLSK